MSAAVPKVSLDLDDLVLDTSADGGPLSPSQRSMVAEAVRPGVEDEKCVVSQYRTTAAQKQAFSRLLQTCHRDGVPVEWVIDIADESNGWFYATAYHYNDSTQMLHVMVPDKENPTFDGEVQLDHRTVHLIECMDGGSLALFNRIVRDSIIKVKWELEWYEDSEAGGHGHGGGGVWVTSHARYYIRMANQLLVEDQAHGGTAEEARGFVIITADLSVRLVSCLKGKGEEDFARLLNEGVVNGVPAAADFAAMVAARRSPKPATTTSTAAPPRSAPAAAEEVQEGGAGNGVRKLADMSKGLRECVADIVEERSKRKAEAAATARLFAAFALEGDLEAGLALADQCQALTSSAAAVGAGAGAGSEEEDKMEAIVEDAVYLSHKLERGLLKVAKDTTGITTGTGHSSKGATAAAGGRGRAGM